MCNESTRFTLFFIYCVVLFSCLPMTNAFTQNDFHFPKIWGCQVSGYVHIHMIIIYIDINVDYCNLINIKIVEYVFQHKCLD